VSIFFVLIDAETEVSHAMRAGAMRLSGVRIESKSGRARAAIQSRKRTFAS
jgi:hypothetical protein